MKTSKTVIAYILLIGGLIRLYFKRDIIVRTFEKGLDSGAPIEQLFIPLLLIVLAIVLFVSIYKKKTKN